jgi:hypothetical protein
MKYVILALLVTSSLSVFAENGETKTEVCTKVNQSNHCKANQKLEAGQCVDVSKKETPNDNGNNGSKGN